MERKNCEKCAFVGECICGASNFNAYVIVIDEQQIDYYQNACSSIK